MSIVEAGQSYNFEAHMARRSAPEPFVMVELGHDSIPVAFQWEGLFTGKNAYIGIEGWLRDPRRSKQRALAQRALDTCTPQHNIFFVAHDTGGRVVRDEDNRQHYHHLS